MPTDWSKVDHFSKEEAWGDPDKINPLLVYSMDVLRKLVGRKIIINNAYRPGDPGTHGRGDAVDFVIVGLSVVDQFLAAEKTRLFTGLGVYPYWNRPGLHADVRTLKPNEHGHRWGRNAAGVYVALDWQFIRNI
ncbi:MAG: hypothetical protein KKB51_18235 [Candidatus Riflebacteria bacterium]|nr:hypothetical protein [Candidatus Riflebacteria bacterium]